MDCKIKKGAILTNAFQKVLYDSKREPNIKLVDEGGEFYNRLMKPWLQDNVFT